MCTAPFANGMCLHALAHCSRKVGSTSVRSPAASGGPVLKTSRPDSGPWPGVGDPFYKVLEIIQESSEVFTIYFSVMKGH